MSTLTPEEKLINAGAIKLDNGKLLINKFGKYRSNLCYVIDPANIPDYKYMDIPSDMNFNVTIISKKDATF